MTTVRNFTRNDRHSDHESRSKPKKRMDGILKNVPKHTIVEAPKSTLGQPIVGL